MINLVAPINKTSYGYVSSEILYYLSQKEDVCLHPIGMLDYDAKYAPCLHKALTNMEKWTPDVSLKVFHDNHLMLHAGNPRISYTFFELDTLQELSRNCLANQDLVIVPTKWAQTVLSNYHIYSEVVPLGISEEFLNYLYNKPQKPLFCIVGKFEKRKGHDIIPAIFKKAFPNNEVDLWCFNDNPFLTTEESNAWTGLFREHLGNRAIFFPRQPSLIPYLKYCHAGIFISRAEGWNLGCLEMMSMGRHVIVTNYSGHTEYCNKDNSLLVDIDELETAYDNKWFFGTGSWAYIGKKQEEQIIEHLRWSYNNFDTINKNGIETGKKFPLKRTVDELHAIIKRVSDNSKKDFNKEGFV